MDEGDEEEYILVNQRMVSRYASEAQLGLFFESAIQEYWTNYHETCLQFADENATLLFLQSWINVKAKGMNKSVRWLFESCSLDLRFFLLLRDNWVKMDLEFANTCQLKSREKSEFEEIANCFSNVEQFTLSLTSGGGIPYSQFPGSNLKFGSTTSLNSACVRISVWPPNSMAAKEQSLINEELRHENDELRTKKSFHFVESDFQYMQVSDFSLLELLLGFPNLTGVQLNHRLASALAERVFHEFCERPANSLPCSFRCQSANEYSYMNQILDHFNRSKLTNFELVLSSVPAEHVEEFLEKTLDVIAHSVYLTNLTVWVENETVKEVCHVFLEKLSQKVTRMRPFHLEVHNNLSIELIDKLAKSITLMSKRCAQGDYCGFLTLVSVRVLMSGERVGSRCYVRMLPPDLIRYLHTFLNWQYHEPPQNIFY